MADTFIRAANPIWYMVDLIGQGLNDEYYAFFLQNVFPMNPQDVFQDKGGTTPWAFPLQFQPSGTLPNNLYFDSALTYRIEIRHGNSQSDPLIWLIQDFVPGQTGVSPGGGNAMTVMNQATNSQFSQVNFKGTLTLTTAGTYNIAPGWDIVLTGTGSMTVQQIDLASNQDQINNPPYALRITSSGAFTSAQLRQRISGNGAIWSSTDDQDGIIGMSITARATGSNYNLAMQYAPSDSGTPTPVASGTIVAGNFSVLDDSVLLPIANNVNVNPNAYVDLIITLQPTTGTIDLSNFMVVGQSIPHGDTPLNVPIYQQETIERQTDQLFHYYKNSIILQPKKSILTGWSFSLNPFQFITEAITTVANQTQYICDQTILHQETASSLNSGVANANSRFGLQVGAVTSATGSRMALMQYIDTTTAWPYWSYNLSALVKASLFSTHGTTVRIKMRLIYRNNNTLPPAIGNTEPIVSWALNSDPVFSAGWVPIAPLNDPIYTLTINSGSFAFPSYAFNGFQLPNNANDTQTLAIVLYTMDNLNSASTADYIVFDKVSLVPNDFAIDESPQTFDEVMRECQYYYEKSYDYQTLPGTATGVGALQKLQTAANVDGSTFAGYVNAFEFEFNSVKRSAPAMIFYSPVATTLNNVRLFAYCNNNTITNFVTQNVASTSWVFTPSTKDLIAAAADNTQYSASGSSVNTACYIRFHYTANALLGAPTGIP